MVKAWTKYLRKKGKAGESWAKKHTFGLFLFNLTVLLMVLLNTAQYFKPFFYLGINAIFFLALILLIILLGARERTMFLIAVVFLVFVAFLRLVKIEVWADRASIYFFQSFFLGLVLLFLNEI